MGPTASGKTVLALELAKRFPLEIISVDSAMVYRGLDIGAAKPTLEERQSVSHHLIDIRDPAELYSVGQFRRDALQKIEEIFSRDKIPLLVGGTVMYFHVLQHGISNLPKSDEATRAKIETEKEKFGLDELFKRLQKIDPQMAEKLKPTDSQRIQRALEVYEITGRTLTELQAGSTSDKLPYEVTNIIVSPSSMDRVRAKVNRRFQEMLKKGFVEEVDGLFKRGDLSQSLPSMKTVGYRQIWQYLAGEISYDQMLELVPIATGQLAKRQLTWLRKWEDAQWFDSDDFSC